MVQDSDKTVINKSLTGLYLLLAGVSLFLLLGCWLLVSSLATSEVDRVGVLIAATTLLFFGFLARIIVQKITQKHPPLVLDSSGITDFTSVAQAGYIPWADIREIGEYWYRGHPFITVHLNDPGKYTSQRNLWGRLMDYANKLMCGSPVAISTYSLDIKHQDLLAMFRTYHQATTAHKHPPDE